MQPMSTHSFQFVGVHLDLKYLMPRKQYLHRWLREIAVSGINTLLLEYEDKFPFQKHPFLCAEDAFTPEQLRSFLQAARDCGIHVIPLVQTLSHLEFALAHEELAHLREAPDILTQINPSNQQALEFVHGMIDEVLAYHEEDEYFHLGADETWFVGTHPDYADEVEAVGLPAYWAKHMRPFMEQVMKAGKRPLVWDDIFWKNPAIIQSLDLPQEMILVSWDYAIREMDASDDSLARVDTYQKAGFEVIGAPCLNWGVLNPMHDHVLENTAAWTQKAKQSEMAGLINTSWSVFHTPLATQMPYIAATAAFLKAESPHLDLAWVEHWGEHWAYEYFGINDHELSTALRNLSANWEQGIEGLGRPLTPIIYGYMDMILFFKSQQDRMKCGSYPLDWNDVDFQELYARKIGLLRGLEDSGLEDKGVLLANLDDLHTTYMRAAEFFHEFSQRVKQHQEEARLLSCFADMKELHARVIAYLLFGRGDATQLSREFDQQKILIASCLEPFFEPSSVARLLKVWWEPPASKLQSRIN
jgi:hypothetical protein